MWRHFTYYSLHFVPWLLYKEIPAEPHGRNLETLPEPAESTYSQNFSCPHQPVGTSEFTRQQ